MSQHKIGCRLQSFRVSHLFFILVERFGRPTFLRLSGRVVFGLLALVVIVYGSELVHLSYVRRFALIVSTWLLLGRVTNHVVESLAAVVRVSIHVFYSGTYSLPCFGVLSFLDGDVSPVGKTERRLCALADSNQETELIVADAGWRFRLCLGRHLAQTTEHAG